MMIHLGFGSLSSMRSSADCKRCEGDPPHRSCFGRFRPELVIVCIAVAMAITSGGTAVADHPSAKQSDKKEQPAETTLTLKSLFHPDQKVDHATSLPETHWLDGDRLELLIRRDDVWNAVDLDDFSEQPWPVQDRLIAQLQTLDGVDADQARETALAAVPKMKRPSDSVLVNVGKSLAVVTPDGLTRWLSRDADRWRNATLDPTARRLAYTTDGDLYVVDVRSDRTVRLTDDGTETLLDGVLDWTYQEEIFGRGNYRGFWFSPDGQWLVMMRIDVSGIEPYVLSASRSSRGRGIVRRYPKAGDPIPHAELYLWDLRRIDESQLPPPRLLAASTPGEPRIITGVWWNPEQNQLLYAVSDRLQSWRELRMLPPEVFSQPAKAHTEPTVLLREESPTWVEPPEAPVWLDDGGIVWKSELPRGRARLFRISGDGKMVTPLTPDDFDVETFAISDDEAFAVVTGDGQQAVADRQVYRVSMTSSKTIELDPVTDAAGWHQADIAPGANWIIDRHSAAVQPPVLAVRSTTSAAQHVLADSRLKLNKPLIQPRILTIETPDGASLPAMLVKPAVAKASEKVPVLMEIYGGPRAPLVANRYSGTRTLYRELLARQGIATLIVDNRSSGGQGLAESWAIHRQVGEVEVKDMLHAVDWLKKQAWVDADRLAIRGWSFGGFLTLYAMTHSDAFAAGIAGGSVTDWREYDAFYTERYMGLPEENPDGYERTAPVRFAEQLHGRVLLIHGEEDDNVHPSGTLRMVEALQKADKDFELMLYPGAAHGITDPSQAWHLAKMTHQFLRKELLRRGE